MPPKKRKGDEDEEIATKKGKEENGNTSQSEPAEDFRMESSLITGELLICGGTNWDMIGRKSVPKGTKNGGGPNLWGPHRVHSMLGKAVRTVISGPTACHSVLITADGKTFTWGRNERGQLGHGDTIRRDVPTLLESIVDVNIIDGACGKNHTLLLSDRGQVFAFGENKMGQLGLGTQGNFVPSPSKVIHKGPPIKRVACGGEFGMIVDVSGNLFSFGCPELGQLGHNSDGKYFVTSNKMGYTCETRPRRVQLFIEKLKEGTISPVSEVEITDVACGLNHSVAVDTKKRVYTWGFGGYGRLGHSGPKDEMVPRLNKSFEGVNRGAVTVAAGTAFTMIVNEMGMLYLSGQQKATGEAAMYPKPVQDLSGWKIRSIGLCNRSVVIAADDSLISWGSSPTCGELGYGENQPHSSSQPQEVKSLHGAYVHKVACGFAHSLLVAKNDTEEEREKLAKLPVFNPQ